jgi:hypothetical protein
MKSLFSAPGLLIDCGRVSKRTRGPGGAFFELGNPPWTQRF